jgi:hypothetical protein
MPRKENLTSDNLAVSIQFVERRIYLIRGHKVMIDADLAELYGVPTRAFIRLRQLLESNEELNRKFAAVIRKLSTHDKYFQVVFDELKKID